MSMAQLNASFSIEENTVAYLGTWRFGAGSPGYGSKMALSIVMDHEDRLQAEAFLSRQYPTLQSTSFAITLPEPAQMETRLYEAMPYPRYPHYFRRHVW